jgi:hypothetical protein
MCSSPGDAAEAAEKEEDEHLGEFSDGQHTGAQKQPQMSS